MPERATVALGIWTHTIELDILLLMFPSKNYMIIYSAKERCCLLILLIFHLFRIQQERMSFFLDGIWNAMRLHSRLLFLDYKFYCYYFPSSPLNMDSLWNTSTCLASDRSSCKTLSYPRTLCTCHDYHSTNLSAAEISTGSHRITATLAKVPFSVQEHTSRIYFCVITLNLRRMLLSILYEWSEHCNH